MLFDDNYLYRLPYALKYSFSVSSMVAVSSLPVWLVIFGVHIPERDSYNIYVSPDYCHDYTPHAKELGQSVMKGMNG